MSLYEKKIAEEAELEAQRLAKIAEEERIRQEKEAELAIIRAEEERIRQEKEAEQERLRKEKEAEQQKELDEFKKANPNININNYQDLETLKEIPIKIKNIIVELLEVEEERVTPEANFTNDLGADELDGTEIAMAIEEEFDIEIPESMPFWGSYFYLSDIGCDTVGRLVDFVLKKID